MRFYDHIGTTGYEVLHCSNERWEEFLELDGTPRASTWKPIRVRRVRPSRREGFRPSDSPAYGGECLIFRRSAVDALRDMLDAHGELLPLEDEDGVELFAHNTWALDAFDHERTVGSRDENGRISLANNHVFIPSVVKDVDIFKQACPRAGNIYVSERFLQRWKQAKLKGLDFILAWDSDLPPEAQPNVWTSKPVKLSTIK
ncbi:MAG TPA: hypothetical protein PK156_45275 [Polyangium sp.]|nr:hypothetical protein [Polyangium sp.]